MNEENSDTYEYAKEVDPETGFVYAERYLKNGILHREDGPAEISRHPASKTPGEYEQIEEWYIEGVRMRLDDGPAIIKRYMPHDRISYRGYFVGGVSAKREWPEPDLD